MRQAVRAIVVKDDHLLVMHRNKFGHEYYTLIGGGVEMGETIDQALIREVAEETGLTLSNQRLVFLEEAGAPYGTQHVYICDYAGGQVQLASDSMEAKINELGKNTYTPMWLPLSQLQQATFRSEPLKTAILNGLAHGFPEKPQVING